jgi:hypothetical protein
MPVTRVPRLAASTVAAILLAMLPVGRAAVAATPQGVGSILCSSQPSAAADFNRDGYTDLVVGAPGDSLEKTSIDGSVTSSTPGAGSINVVYGSSKGLQPGNTPAGSPSFISQDTPGVVDDAHPGDAFGSSLATGDFNGDGYPDLAVGVPGEDSQAGAVHIFYGGPAGIRPGTPGSSTYNQVVKVGGLLRGQRLGSGRNPGDLFGWALATGDINGDGKTDLVIGAPGFNVHGVPDAGLIIVLFGTSQGLTAAGFHVMYQDGSGDLRREVGDYFGASIATGDFDASTPVTAPRADDIAVGAPGEDVGRAADAGAVSVYYDNSARTGAFFTEATPDLPAGGPATSDRFGCSLAAGNFDHDAANDIDLAIGIPGKAVGSATQAGAVVTLYNSKGLRTTNVPEDCSATPPPSGTTGVTPGATITATTITPNDCWTESQAWTENAGGIPGVAKKGDQFGASLYSADLNKDGPADLVVGVPNETLYGDAGAGSVRVIFGFDKFGLTDCLPSASSRCTDAPMAFAQRPSDNCTADDAENAGVCASSPGYTEVGMTVEKNDHFGQSLAVGNFDGDSAGAPDIVVGVPGESVGAVVNYAMEEMLGYPSDGAVALHVDDSAAAGVIQVIYGGHNRSGVVVGGGTPDVLYRQQGGLRALIDGLSAIGGQTDGNGIGDTLISDTGGKSGAPGGGGLIGDPGLQATDGGPSASSTLTGDRLGAAIG